LLNVSLGYKSLKMFVIMGLVLGNPSPKIDPDLILCKFVHSKSISLIWEIDYTKKCAEIAEVSKSPEWRL